MPIGQHCDWGRDVSTTIGTAMVNGLARRRGRRQTVRLQVRMPPSLHLRLSRLAAERCDSIAALVRDALIDYLAVKERR